MSGKSLSETRPPFSFLIVVVKGTFAKKISSLDQSSIVNGHLLNIEHRKED